MNLAPFDMDSQNSGSNPRQATGLSHETENGILKVFVRGSVALSDVTAYVTRYQDIWTAHSRILWDLREFDPSALSSSDILNIQHAFGEILDLRTVGRSAVLISKELDLVVRVALALGDDQRQPIQLSSFLDESQALTWLATDDFTGK